MDNTVPALTTIYLNLTERCNMKCIHCWLNPDYTGTGFETVKPLKTEISDTEIRRIIEQSMPLGLKGIKITGGEPFLRKDIFEILGIITRHNLKVHIETNASLLDKEKIKKLKKNGLNGISVSLDAATEKKHDKLRGLKNSFQKTLNAIDLLVKNKISTEVIMSIFNINIDEFPIFIKLMKNIGVRHVKLNTIIPTGRGLKIQKMGLAPDIKTLLEFNKLLEKNFSEDKKINIHFSIPVAFKSIHSITKNRDNQCGIMNIMGILSNGDFSICGIGRTEKALVMGNIRRDRLDTTWKKHPILVRMRKQIPDRLKGVCGNCMFKNICLGFCRANAFSVSKDILAPSWMCEEAFNKGMFPEKRLREIP